MSTSVSVVVPTHNRSRLLALTLRSILSQERVDLDVVVVDDGSSDDTAAVVAGFEDHRLRMVRHDTPVGVSGARNHGITEARGAWVGFCDDDDLWAPDKLTKQLEAGNTSGRMWVCAGHVDVTPRLRVVAGGPPPPPDEIVRLLPYRNVVPGGGSGVIVRRETLAVVGGFDQRLHNAEDWELWLRLADMGAPALVAEPLVAYRLNPGGASLAGRVMLQDVEIIERTHGIRTSRAAIHRYLGWWALRTGHRGRAFAHFVHELRHHDALASRRDAIDDLAYLFRDALLALPTNGRRRAQPRGKPDEATAAWRHTAQAWVDRLVGSAGGPETESSHA